MDSISWRTAIACDWRVLEVAPAHFSDNRQLALETVKQTGMALSLLSDRLRADQEVVLAAIKQDDQAIFYGSQELQGDTKFVLQAVRVNEKVAYHLSPELLSDRPLVLEAVALNWKFLEHISEDLRGDAEVCLVAVRQHHRAMEYISPELCGNRDFMREVILSTTREMLNWASADLKIDRELVLLAVKQNAKSTALIPLALRQDREFMFSVLQQNAGTFRIVAEMFGSDRDFWVRTIRDFPDGWERLKQGGPAALREDRDFIIQALSYTWRALEFASETLRADPEIVLKAIRGNWQAVHAAKVVRLDHMVEAVKQDWRAVHRFVDDGFVQADAVVLVQTNPEVVKHPALGCLYECALTAVKRDGLMLQYISEELQDCLEVVEVAVVQNWESLQYASERLRGHRPLAEIAFKQDGLALRHCTEELRSDRRVVMHAMRRNMNNFQFCTDTLRADPVFWDEACRRFPALWKIWLQSGVNAKKPDKEVFKNGSRIGPLISTADRVDRMILSLREERPTAL